MEINHEDMLQALLNWCFENTNILQAEDGSGDSLIHFASEKGFTPIVKSLLEENVNVNLKGTGQSTPLHLSAENGHIETSNLLSMVCQTADARKLIVNALDKYLCRYYVNQQVVLENY